MKLYEKRYSERVFDTEKQIDDNILKEIMNWGVYSPSSLGLEAWQFVVIQNQDIKDELFESSFGQIQVKEAPAVIIMLSRKGETFVEGAEFLKDVANKRGDKTEEQKEQYANGVVAQMRGALNDNDMAISSWLKSQTYIAAGQIALGATENGLATVIMEGFNPMGITQTLVKHDLINSDEFNVCTMIPLGYAKNEYDYSKKSRFDFDRIVKIVK